MRPKIMCASGDGDYVQLQGGGYITVFDTENDSSMSVRLTDETKQQLARELLDSVGAAKLVEDVESDVSVYVADIGGRAIDVGCIGGTLSQLVKESFAINQVPEQVVGDLKEVCARLDSAERAIQLFISGVRAAGIKDFPEN